MVMTNVTLTIPADELFELCHAQVDPSLHDRLRAEIARRWPAGLRVPVALAPAANQPQ